MRQATVITDLVTGPKLEEAINKLDKEILSITRTSDFYRGTEAMYLILFKY